MGEPARGRGAPRPAVTWYGDDTQRARAMAILTALLGSYGRKGGLFFPTPVPAAMWPSPTFPSRPASAPTGPALPTPLASEESGLTNGLDEGTLTEKPYPIKGWIVYAQKRAGEHPAAPAHARGDRQARLMVVVDVLPVEQTAWADLVLPRPPTSSATTRRWS